jgi:hypothetical protein
VDAGGCERRRLELAEPSAVKKKPVNPVRRRAVNRRLELAELKHGRLAMAAVALHWATKLAGARGSAAAALAAGVPRGALTFAHQLWGEIRRESPRFARFAEIRRD